MIDFTPHATRIKELQDTGISLQEAKAILTGRNVLAELQDISANLHDPNPHSGQLQAQMARLTDTIMFLVAKGSIKF